MAAILPLGLTAQEIHYFVDFSAIIQGNVTPIKLNRTLIQHSYARQQMDPDTGEPVSPVRYEVIIRMHSGEFIPSATKYTTLAAAQTEAASVVGT